MKNVEKIKNVIKRVLYVNLKPFFTFMYSTNIIMYFIPPPQLIFSDIMLSGFGPCAHRPKFCQHDISQTVRAISPYFYDWVVKNAEAYRSTTPIEFCLVQLQWFTGMLAVGPTSLPCNVNCASFIQWAAVQTTFAEQE